MTEKLIDTLEDLQTQMLSELALAALGVGAASKDYGRETGFNDLKRQYISFLDGIRANLEKFCIKENNTVEIIDREED